MTDEENRYKSVVRHLIFSKCIATDGRDHDCLDETAPHLVTPW